MNGTFFSLILHIVSGFSMFTVLLEESFMVSTTFRCVSKTHWNMRIKNCISRILLTPGLRIIFTTNEMQLGNAKL